MDLQKQTLILLRCPTQHIRRPDKATKMVVSMTARGPVMRDPRLQNMRGKVAGQVSIATPTSVRRRTERAKAHTYEICSTEEMTHLRRCREVWKGQPAIRSARSSFSGILNDEGVYWS